MKEERRLTVFTVDDSEIVCKNLGLLLAENKNVNWLGHAFSLADAYEQIAAKEPEIVILDIQLKDSNTFELLEFLKKQSRKISVVMLSNLATEPYRQKCLSLGADFFLDKSGEFEKILPIIESLVR